MSHKSKQFLLLACKIVVVLCCLVYLSWQLDSRSLEWQEVVLFLNELPIFLFIILPLLSICSWLVESLKWQQLVSEVDITDDEIPKRGISFNQSIVQNLTANAASFITPLRAGEFATKAFYFYKKDRPFVLRAVLMGTTSQMTVTLLLGVAGLAVLYNQALLAFLLLLIGCLSLVVLSPTIAKRLRFYAIRFDKVTMFSFMRYVLFSFSWLVVLVQVSPVSLFTIMSAITAMYLVASIIPTMQILDVFLKWTIATFFVGFLDISIEVMTSIVAIIWINNQVLPVLLGCSFLAFQKFPKLVAV